MTLLFKINSTLPLTLSSSDHYLVLSVLSPFHLTQLKPIYTKTIQGSLADWEGMIEFLTHYDFNPIYTLFDINTKWEFLKGVILEATSKLICFSSPNIGPNGSTLNSTQA